MGLAWDSGTGGLTSVNLGPAPTDYADLMTAVLRNMPGGEVTVSMDEVARYNGEEVVVVRDDLTRTFRIRLVGRCPGCGDLEDENHPMGGQCVTGSQF